MEDRDTLIQLAKTETLLAMYKSVERMNYAIMTENHGMFIAEKGLQKNLRKNLESLSRD
jgi:hypothetical protein